jgi:hypothetical protein
MMAVLLRRALAAFNDFGVLAGWMCWVGAPPTDWSTAIPPRPTEPEPGQARPLSDRERRAWTRLMRDLSPPPDLADAWERAGRS